MGKAALDLQESRGRERCTEPLSGGGFWQEPDGNWELQGKTSEQLLSSCYSRQLLIEDCIWWNLHEIPFFLPNYMAGIMIQENPWTIYEVNFVKGKLWTTFDLFNLFDKLWIWPSLGEGNCWEGKRAQGLYLHGIVSGSKENLWLFNYFSPILAFVSYHPVLDHVTCHIGLWLLFPLLIYLMLKMRILIALLTQQPTNKTYYDKKFSNFTGLSKIQYRGKLIPNS